ncbi:MAG: methionyl-tRNA formyltransferase [Bacteroidales bacterium]|nr:methionyl-tRNA formyltransferase [Bacteroidales bacterium]
MGTPDFAVPSLDILVKNDFDVVGVVTSLDKPAGRGRKITHSPVKEYAVANNLPVLQPNNLKDKYFINQLKSLNPDLQVVVAFRMLPEVVWGMPPLGTFNLHASLLPQYRGAAPINRAIINGETETGVTTFFLDKEIDTGKIILSEKIAIGNEETAGELHDRLMEEGAKLVLLTIETISESNYKLKSQNDLITSEISLKKAPKIFKEDCRVDWKLGVDNIYNFIRGLSPYPSAFTELLSPAGETWMLKIYKAQKILQDKNPVVGTIQTDGKSYLNILCADGFISIIEIQLAGKRRMNITEFLKGFTINDAWKVKI